MRLVVVVVVLVVDDDDVSIMIIIERRLAPHSRHMAAVYTPITVQPSHSYRLQATALGAR